MPKELTLIFVNINITNDNAYFFKKTYLLNSFQIYYYGGGDLFIVYLILMVLTIYKNISK